MDQRRKPAVRLRMPRVAHIERVASIALAMAATVATGIFVIAAPGRFTLVPTRDTRRSANEVAERLRYIVASDRAPVTAPLRHATLLSRPPEPRRDTSSSLQEPVQDPEMKQLKATPDAVFSFRAQNAIVPVDSMARAATPQLSAAGAPLAGLTVGFTAHPSRPMRFDSALQAVHDSFGIRLRDHRIAASALTQAERDEQLRARALDGVAANGAGLPSQLGTMSGGGVAVGLPFGGPSREQRERDRRDYARAKEMLARVQRRADSVVAARRRRYADSLAQVADSQRRRAP